MLALRSSWIILAYCDAHLIESKHMRISQILYHAQGDALYSMELALSLEKLNFIKLRELHRVAANAEDAQLADFIGECIPRQMHLSAAALAVVSGELLLTAGCFIVIMAAAPLQANEFTGMCQHMTCNHRDALRASDIFCPV